MLRGVGENGIVASICPKHTQPAPGLSPEADDAYGYNPAIEAMTEIFKSRLAQECLPRPLPVEADPKAADFGQVPCAVVEAKTTQGGACTCDATQGRTPVTAGDETLPAAVRDQLMLEEHCGGSTGVSCNDYCLCKLDSLSGAALDACQNGTDDGSSYGYCYIDPAQGIGNPALVDHCAVTERRSLRSSAKDCRPTAR